MVQNIYENFVKHGQSPKGAAQNQAHVSLKIYCRKTVKFLLNRVGNDPNSFEKFSPAWRTTQKGFAITKRHGIVRRTGYLLVKV